MWKRRYGGDEVKTWKRRYGGDKVKMWKEGATLHTSRTIIPQLVSDLTLASSPGPIFILKLAGTKKIGPGIHWQGLGAHALAILQNLENRALLYFGL